MKKIASLWIGFFCFLVWVFTSGCATLPTSSTLFPVDFARVDVPEPEVPIAESDWCEKAKPLAPGQTADCVGILTPPHKLSHLMTESEILVQTKKVIQSSYSGRDADRVYAASVLAGREEQLKIAKDKHPKLFGVGVGVGAGSVVAIIAAVLLARPPQ
tara:strand:+ start:15517 stop:15990 length:474 start_codon:yes stop_codon:yes gene_type:complete